MKRHSNIITIILTLGLFACNNFTDKTTKKDQKFDCNLLTEKKVIYEIATSIIEKHGNEQIWNLSEIDTTNLMLDHSNTYSYVLYDIKGRTVKEYSDETKAIS